MTNDNPFVVQNPDALRIQKLDTTEVLRISFEGRIFWRGREVEADDDFRAAMLDLRDYLMGVGK